jgi:nucleotide-binding universal stress UspA family protein
MFERILVPFDGSDNSKKALQVAIDLASKYDSRLYIIEVVNETIFYSVGILPPLKELESMDRKAKEDVKFAVTEAERVGVRAVGETLEGDPAQAILDYVDKNSISLIVMGSRGLSTVKRVFLGSVSSRVVQEARVPVLIVK